MGFLGIDALIERKIKSIIASQGASSTVDVRGGSIHIENVHFNEQLIDDALAKATGEVQPVIIEMIYVHKMIIKIPWTGGELGVSLDGVHVLLRRRPDEEVTAAEQREAKEKHITAKLESLVAKVKAARKGGAAAKADGDDSDDDSDDDDEKKRQKSGGGGMAGRMVQKMVESLANKILKNLEPKVSITNLHVRYEDLLPETGAPVAVGLAFGSFELGRSAAQNLVVSLDVALSNVGVYAHTRATDVQSVVPPAPTRPPEVPSKRPKKAAKTPDVDLRQQREEQVAANMTSLLADVLAADGSPGKLPEHQWLLRPMAMACTAHVNVGTFLRTKERWAFPVAVADLRFAPIEAQLTEAHAEALCMTGSWLQGAPSRYMYKFLRPSERPAGVGALYAPPTRIRRVNVTWREYWQAAILTVLRFDVERGAPAMRFRQAAEDRAKYKLAYERVLEQTSEAMAKAAEVAVKARRQRAAEEEAESMELEAMNARNDATVVSMWRLLALRRRKAAERSKGFLGALSFSKPAYALQDGDIESLAVDKDEEDRDDDADKAGDEDGGLFGGAPEGYRSVVVRLGLDTVRFSLLLLGKVSDAPGWRAPGRTALAPASTPVLSAGAHAISVQANVEAGGKTQVRVLVGEVRCRHCAGRAGDVNLLHLRGYDKIAPNMDGVLDGALPLPPQESGFLSSMLGRTPKKREGKRDGPEFAPALHAVVVLPEPPPPPNAPPPPPGLENLELASPPKLPGRLPSPPKLPGRLPSPPKLPGRLPSPPKLPPPPKPAAQPPPGDAQIDVALALRGGEACTHPGLWPSFVRFFQPVEIAFDRLAGAAAQKAALVAAASTLEAALGRPWWGLEGGLVGAFGGLGAAVEGLVGLRVKAEVTEPIELKLYKPAPPTAAAPFEEVVRLTLPPLSASIVPECSAVGEGPAEVLVDLDLGSELRFNAANLAQLGQRAAAIGAAAERADASGLAPALRCKRAHIEEEVTREREALHAAERELRRLQEKRRQADEAAASARAAKLRSGKKGKALQRGGRKGFFCALFSCGRRGVAVDNSQSPAPTQKVSTQHV